jgi:bifunctional non-homologous end joining protein LigD
MPSPRKVIPTSVSVAGVELSNPNKLLYPDARLSKLDLARYYETIGDWIVPHLANRPLSLLRCPDGWTGQCFYQKHADKGAHSSVERVEVPEATGNTSYMMITSVAGVVDLVRLGVLEFHPWGSQAPKLDRPDRLVFDFDPDDSITWNQLAEAVQLLRSLLVELGLTGFLKTSGGKGLHVVVPIRPTLSWDQAKRFAKAIADSMVQTFPDRFIATASKSRRKGLIFVDHLRNAEGATAVCAYSLRAPANAPVATPIAWEELTRDVRFDYFNLRNIPPRLERLKANPWGAFFDLKQSVTAAMLKRLDVAR